MRAALRDALRTIQALGSREQKMSTTALGDRDAFGVKLGPAGAVVQVFQMRGGRVIERIELVSENAGSEVEVLEAAVQQFYESREPPPEIHVPAPLPESEAMETWLADRSNRRVRVSWSRSAARSAACSSSRPQCRCRA